MPSFSIPFSRLAGFLAGFMIMALLAACGRSTTPTVTPEPTTAPTVAATATPTRPAPTATPIPPTPTPEPIALALPPLPASWEDALQEQLASQPRLAAGRPLRLEATGANRLQWQPLPEAEGLILARRSYALAAPFATVRDELTWDAFLSWWRGEADRKVWLAAADAAMLSDVFGPPGQATVTAAPPTAEQLASSKSWTLLPFDSLDPTYKVLRVAGFNVLSNQLDTAHYPLTLALSLQGPNSATLQPWLQPILQPADNRDPARLTQLIMTGVTAMSRGTAAKMEEKGVLYPALVISDTLSAADITHVSNEVPFLKDCQVNNTYMNLVLCSDTRYWAALEAIGTDIVGLSGNHVNDFGRKGARESLQFYKDKHIPIYGSGLNEEEACAPLLWEDHGNRFAFLAALAWWPESAWATEDQPGACNYYRNRDAIIESIRELSQEVDIVAVELQFQETYNPWPTRDQVAEFRDLRAAGADIVTGVQSHVPQALEPYGRGEADGPGIIVYGLGNLFFDQMQDWETRTGLIARHTIYDGRLLSTEILTTVLEDFAQPRWASSKERAGILRSIFEAAPAKDSLPTPEPTPTPEPQTPTITPAADSTDASPTATPTPIPQPGAPWPTPDPAAMDHTWLRRPVDPPANTLGAVTYAFGNSQNGRYRVHHGTDIANPMDTPLLAPITGTIVYAGLDQPPWVLGAYPDFFGNVILLQSDQSWQGRPLYVLYGHMQTVSVSPGQHVTPGQEVGRVGMTGIAIGPHVHVEVRLDDTGYNQSYNAELWMTPLPGYGTLAGQVVTPDGRAWPEVNLLIYRSEADGQRLVRVATTYADDPGIHPDPVWAENFVAANLPAGAYQVVLRLRGQTLTQNVSVVAGQTAYARFVVAP